MRFKRFVEAFHGGWNKNKARRKVDELIDDLEEVTGRFFTYGFFPDTDQEFFIITRDQGPSTYDEAASHQIPHVDDEPEFTGTVPGRLGDPETGDEARYTLLNAMDDLPASEVARDLKLKLK